MSFVEHYIKRPHLVLSLIILSTVLGIMSFKSLPTNLFPDVNYPKIVVVLQLPGESAEDMERQVAIPVEKEMATLSLVRKVKSVSRDGVSVISVEFDYKKGLSAAQVDVSSALDRVMSDLPEGLLPPRIYKVSDATTPAMTIALSPREGSNLTLVDIRRIAENYIKPEFLNAPDIGDAEVFGGYEPEIFIEVRRDDLSRYGLSLEDIAIALHSENANLPSGIIRTGKKEIFIRIPGEEVEPERISKITIPCGKGSIHLGDIATIRVAHADRESLFHGNGKPAVAINILRPETGNVMSAIRSAKRVLQKVKREFPQIEFSIADTQENVIRTSISNLKDALRDAIVLTIAVIFFLMARIRATVLTAISIPVTYFTTFLVMRIMGMELNIVTMTGIILAVGLLVDDSIVVTENIERHLREGKISPKEAAISGTSEIMLADFSGTLTTVLVLIPIMFIGGYVEKILRQLAMVLTISLLSSYLVSITVIPLLAPYILEKDGRSKPEKAMSKLNEALLRKFQQVYVGLFRFGAKHKLALILPAVALLAISVKRVMPLVGRDLMPPMDTGIAKVLFEIDPNTPVEKAEGIVDCMEQSIKRIPGFIRMEAVMGSEPGAISFGVSRTPRQGIITFHLVDRFHRKSSIWDAEDTLYKRFSTIPGLKSLHIFEFGATPLSSITAPVDVMVSGENPETLDRIAGKIEKRLRKVRGITSISRTWNFDRMEYWIEPNLEKLAIYGLNPKSISLAASSAFSGRVSSLWHIPEEQPYPIRLRLPESERKDLANLLDLSIPSPKGAIPLRELVEVKTGFVRSIITRQNLKPVVDILGYRRRSAISHIQKRVNMVIKGVGLPKGFRIYQEGEIKPMKEAFGRLRKVLVISLILLYFSLVPTFHSFKHPITIMVAIPLALIGAIWGLLVAGKHFCMPAFMGMVLLSGIVVNNSILLLDFAERERKKGVDMEEAVERAIRARTRPILMTALSTIAGMLPIAAERAVGLERLSPLAVVATGGLLLGTFLTLVYVPLIYLALERKG